MAKEVRTTTQAGKGDPPYLWSVDVLNCVDGEGDKLFTSAQRAHLIDQIRELARAPDPTHPVTVSVDAIEDFHELRDKGGVLGKLNVRVFFGVVKETQTIVILGVIKKEAEGRTPQGDKVRMRRRWRKYRDGDFR